MPTKRSRSRGSGLRANAEISRNRDHGREVSHLRSRSRSYIRSRSREQRHSSIRKQEEELKRQHQRLRNLEDEVCIARRQLSLDRYSSHHKTPPLNRSLKRTRDVVF